jgi:voltage-gated sodium channel
MTASLGANLLRQRKIVLDLVESRLFTRTIIGLILINAVILGLETSPAMMSSYGPALVAADQLILGIFVVELTLRLFAHLRAFFRDPWSLFDTAVVVIALFPASEAFSVLRALRVLRVLRLVSAFPQLRRVIMGLLTAIPGLGSIAAILAILLYIFAVIAVNLFGAQYLQWFGDFGVALFTLFQIMTLEGWADIAREIQQTHPHAWTFFIVYILISTFAVLNLFIAVIVDAMQKGEESMEHELQASIAALGKKIDQLGGINTTNAAKRCPDPHSQCQGCRTRLQDSRGT